jgi:macrolide transport system ATP-binding/permease protein
MALIEVQHIDTSHANRRVAATIPLIELQHIDKTYKLGEVAVPVLKDVSLSIEPGEFVALMGASGSGKTTLMNLLGCLDRPDQGSYRLGGTEVCKLVPSQLAQLRSRHMGFVFQSFNLLPRATALENVTMPAAYVAEKRSRRHVLQRGRELLRTVGLEARMGHTLSKLSGGEQQRVAIARALINEPALLLADEPTGNLDSQTGKEILQLFRRLNMEQGITILLVTHDVNVAKCADRVIRSVDGRFAEDSRETGRTASAVPKACQGLYLRRRRRKGLRGTWSTIRLVLQALQSSGLSGIWSTIRLALQALRRNVTRTTLTIMGIIIGVAAVIAMMEISRGASEAIQVTVTNLGANTLSVFPSVPQGDSGRIGDSGEYVTPDDAKAIRDKYVEVVSTAPVVEAWAQVIYGNRSWVPTYLIGSTAEFLDVRNWNELELGRVFSEREVVMGSKVCLIGKTLVRKLFGSRGPIGEEIRVNNVSFKVIGVLSRKGANLLGTDQDDILLAPWTTVKYRINGGGTESRPEKNKGRSLPGIPLAERLPGIQHGLRTESVEYILIKAGSQEAIPTVSEATIRLLHDRRNLSAEAGKFEIYNMAEVSNAMKKMIRMLSGLGMSVAAISLLVGGVGIMNIMLVSVTERTREIGLRMAVGADASDILRQFLVEAIVLCLVGGLAGIVAGRAGSLLVGALMGWPTHASPAAATVAVAVSTTVGITFGYYPAWKASKLNPIDALRYE